MKNEDKFGEYFDNTILTENNQSNNVYSFSKCLSKMEISNLVLYKI